MILKITAICLISVVLLNGANGASYSKVFVQNGGADVGPVEYSNYGAPVVASPQIARLSAAPIGSDLPVQTVSNMIPPCVSPCVVPPPGVAPSPSANFVTYNAPNVPVVIAPSKDNGYEYSYVVYDENTGDRKAQRELSDGAVVRGEYSFLQPDGYVREVQYRADDLNGFNVIVKKILPEAVGGEKKHAPCPNQHEALKVEEHGHEINGHGDNEPEGHHAEPDHVHESHGDEHAEPEHIHEHAEPEHGNENHENEHAPLAENKHEEHAHEHAPPAEQEQEGHENAEPATHEHEHDEPAAHEHEAPTHEAIQVEHIEVHEPEKEAVVEHEHIHEPEPEQPHPQEHENAYAEPEHEPEHTHEAHVVEIHQDVPVVSHQATVEIVEKPHEEVVHNMISYDEVVRCLQAKGHAEKGLNFSPLTYIILPAANRPC